MKFIILSLLMMATTLFANIGQISAVKGDATLQRDTQSIKLKVGTILQTKDSIKTGEDGRVQIVFKDKTVISVGKKSNFSINDYFYDEAKPKQAKASFGMASGIFKSITGKIGKVNPGKFKMKTRTASIGIRGTVFFGVIPPPPAPGEVAMPESIACTQGKIVVETPAGIVVVPAGQVTSIVSGQAPSTPTAIPASQAQALQNDSGAQENEQESGQTEQTVQEENSKVTQSESQTTTEENNEETAPAQESNDEEKAAPVAAPLESDTPDDTPPPPVVTEAVPVDVVETVVNDTADTATETLTQDSTNEVTETISSSGSSSFGDISGDGTPVNGTYDVYHSGYFYQSSTDSYLSGYGSYQNSDGTATDRAQFTATDGLLNGESTLYFTDYLGNAIEGIPSSTLNLENERIPNPYTTYSGIGYIEESEYIGSYGDSTYSYNDLDILSDSKQEFFFVREAGGSVVYDEMYDYYVYSDYYNETNELVFGIKSKFSELPTDGVSFYLPTVEYEGQYSYPVFYDWLVDPYESDYYDDSESSYSEDGHRDTYFVDFANLNIQDLIEHSYYGTYINWKNKNILYYDIDSLFSSYDQEIVIGKIVDDNDNAKITYNSYTAYDDIVSSEVYLFGSEQQAIGGAETISLYNNVEYDQLIADFKIPGLESTVTPTGSLELDGFAVSYPNSSSYPTLNMLSLSTDRLNTLSGSITCNMSSMNITFGGDLGVDAAYITDESFASFGFSGTNSGESTVDDGYILAIDTDRYDAETNTATDGISWGIWEEGTLEDSNNYASIPNFWVAGVDRVEDMVASLGSDFTGTYVGNIMGNIQGDISGVLNPIESTINLDFDFNAGTIDAAINAVTTAEETVSSTQSLTSSFSGAVYQGSNAQSMIQGSFYNNGATTAGGFSVTEGTNMINGVYKAAKQ